MTGNTQHTNQPTPAKEQVIRHDNKISKKNQSFFFKKKKQELLNYAISMKLVRDLQRMQNNCEYNDIFHHPFGENSSFFKKNKKPFVGKPL